MNSITIDGAIAQNGPAERAEHVNAVVFYDDVSAGNRAMGLLARLAAPLGAATEIHVLPWRMDLLGDPRFSEQAEAEAAAADLLVISAGNEEALGPSARDWLASCIRLKRTTPAAVIALLGPDDGLAGADSPGLESMCDAARESAIDFFAPSRPVSPPPANVLEAWSCPGYDAPRHWGINE